ncbi:MAG: S8 family serine peptidase, partial [Schleiferiaceae bacterium]|nr:S8 family serine peptidase [Schleiferiaceae bacterium]
NDLRARLADGTAPLMLVSNHSYAPTEGWATGTFWRGVINVSKEKAFRFGRYGARDAQFDAIVYDYPHHTLVLAAANARGEKYGGSGTIQAFEYNSSDGSFSTYNFTGFDPIPEEQDYDCIPNGNLGKNVITVGAVGTVVGGYDAGTPAISTKSSIGPTDDGRIKPDLVAPSSTSLLTSFAAPQVSGSALLLQELNFKNKGHYLLASTIKALFIHTAFPMSTGPSYEFGWGAIQPTVAADFILSTSPNKQVLEANLENGQPERYYLYLDGDFKSTLVWTDPAKDETPLSYVPADLNKDYITLVNDLDMRLRPISDYTAAGEQPWLLDKDNPADPATKGDNSRDNVEQLDATGLAAGWYELEINHKGTLLNSDPQAYSLIIEGAENGNCLVTNRPEPEQTYSGGTWSATEATDKHTYIRENVTLSSGTSVIKDLIADPNITITLNHNLEITGNLVLGKDVQFAGSGTITFSGGAAQTACGCAMDSLIIDNANGVTLAGNPTIVGDGLKIKTGGTLNTNGLLTLRGKQGGALENRYAQLDETDGTITGPIRFESWIEGVSGWRHIALPVATTVKKLVSDFTFYTLNPAGPSIMRWNATTAAWEAPELNDVLSAGTPLAVYFGTSPGGTEFTPLPFLLSVYGVPGSGTQNNTLTYGAAFPDANDPPTQTEAQRTGWNFIGNPYPQNLDWKTIAEDIIGTDVSNAYYVWNGTSYLARSGATASDDGTGDAPLQIAPMKGFFVKAEDAAASSTSFFNFTHADRTSVRGAFAKKGQEQLKLVALAGNATEDAFFIAFSEASTATNQFDPQHDAYKLMSPLEDVVQIFQTPNIEEDRPALAIQVLPAGAPQYTLPITVHSKDAAAITLTMDRSEWPESEWVFFIENLETRDWHDLSTSLAFQSTGGQIHFRLHLFS